MELHEARIAILLENLYQELELWYPVMRFREAGADVRILAPSADEVYGSKLGYPATADHDVTAVDATSFDAVIIPGGFSPEYLRRHQPSVDLVRRANELDRIVAAICHAGWMLATAGIAKGRNATCVPVIRDDLVNAGATYLDEPVVRDGNLITSRLPNDLPQFCDAIATALGERVPCDGPALPPLTVPSSAVYTSAALVKNRAAGPASANYRAYATLVG